MITFLFLHLSSVANAETTSLSDAKPNSTIIISSVNEDKRVDAWYGIDKLKHYSVSLILTTSSYYYMKKPIGYSNSTSLSVSVPFTLFIGIGKELIDKREDGNRFSMKDLAVDIMGIASGWIITNNLR